MTDLLEHIHTSVMPQEILHWIAPVAGGLYLDVTLGLGGHTKLLLDSVDGNAYFLGLDRDENAIAQSQRRLQQYDSRVSYFHGSFQFFAAALKQVGWSQVDGVIADLGVSSMQLDTPERGFSFLHDGPLDMRMDSSSDLPTAEDLVNTASLASLKEILWKYGEEPLAGRIARAIVERRQTESIRTTEDLAQIVKAAYPAKRRALARNHPATKTFQALRIAVNQELDEIESFLMGIVDYIRPGGRIAVISFHSLEDRIVKNVFRRESSGCLCPREYPECQCGHSKKLKILTKKPLIPSDAEMQSNSRSRSAKLRVAERLESETE